MLSRLWSAGGGLISIQVLQELYVTLTNRAKMAMGLAEARTVISNLGAWQVYSPVLEDVLAAADGAARWNISFWDSLIVVAAKASGANVIWSEDLNHSQRYDGLEVRNPFLGQA